MKTLISQSSKSLVYLENTGVENEVWKISTGESNADLLSKEFEWCSKLDFKGFRKAIALREYRSRPALVLAHISGDTLENAVKQGVFSISEFLSVALECAEIMEQLSQNRLVHNRINSKNLIYNGESTTVVLIDFAFAERSPFEFSGAMLPQSSTVEEIVYYAPELVGRFDQKIDNRSDLFSLGIVFYQMLTGQLPFYGKEISEICYAIIAQAPTSIRWLNPNVPKSIEDIIFKLLAKSPEDRYQTALGLMSDLRYCLDHLGSPSKMYQLVTGHNDYSSVLNVSQHIYGRSHIKDLLQQQMSKITQGAKALVAVVGAEGTGKSIMGNIVFQECIKVQSWFISGKYDRSHKGTPYYAVVAALKQLAALMLSAEEGRLNWWKKRIQAAVGNLGGVLIELIPEFKWILGEQPLYDTMDGNIAQSRTIYLFQRIVETVTSHGQPLVMFLDDVDLSDSSSKQMIKSLVSYPSIHNFMIVCTSRVHHEEYFSVSKAFALTETESPNFVELVLENLDYQEVEKLIADTLKIDNIAALSEVVYTKTGGNPLFVHQFMQYIIDKQMIYFDPKKKTWRYDLMGISSFQATQNVIDLVISKLKKLTPMGNHILNIASCLEDPFTVAQVKDLAKITDEECNHIIRMLLDTGMIQQESHGNYKFSHDRLKHTVYEAIPDQERIKLHYSIGIWYLDKYHKDLEVNIYELAKNLNLSAALLPDSLREEYIRINYKAGLKSKVAGAFNIATEYFEYAYNVIVDNDWKENYVFVMGLYLEAAKVSAVNGNRSRATLLADIALEHAQNTIDRIKCKEIYLHVLTESHQLSEAVDLLLTMLKDLGFPLQRKPSPVIILKELVRTKSMLWFKSKEDILNLPDMKHAHAIAFMRLTAESASSIFGAAPEVFPLIIFKQVQLSLKYGNSAYSPNGYVAYGFALSSILGNINKGYEFGIIALDLMKKYESKEIYAKVVTIFYAFLSYWKRSIRESIEPLKQSYQIGRENGDLLYASFSTSFHSSILFFSGERLDKVLSSMTEGSLLIQSMNQELVFTLSETQRQFVENLVHVKSDYLTIIGDETTEEEFLNKLKEKKDKATLFYFYVYKLLLAYWFNDTKLAYEYSQNALQYEEDTSSRQTCYPYFLLFSSLALIKYGKSLSNGNEKRKVSRRAKFLIKKLKEIAEHAPENFESKYCLALASYKEMRGASKVALELYSKSIQAARDNGFIQEEALGYELLAQYYSNREEWSMAEVFVQKSWKCYEEWGATNKSRHLIEAYPEFLQNLYHASQNKSTKVDLLEAMLASQALSSEVTLDGFLSKVVQLILEHPTIQNVAVVVKDIDESFILKALGNNSGVKLLPTSERILDKIHLPISIVHYVTRTKQYYMSEAIASDPVFANDTYFAGKNIQSVCCFPIIKNMGLLGLIYMENTSSRDSFDMSLIEFLRALSGQISISLENALLFENQVRIRRLENDYNQNLLTVSHQAEENERKRIAEELHDDIGALLSTTKLYLSHMPVREEEGNVQLKVKDLLDKAIHTVRNLSHRLSPISLDKFGLKTVLEGLCNEINSSGALRVEYEINLESRLSLNQELQLYRISQELFSNTIKYSQASLVILKIDTKLNTLKYVYKDNGIGFDIDQSQTTMSNGKGIGLHNVSNRVKLINGQLTFESHPGAGVKVIIQIDDYMENHVN